MSQYTSISPAESGIMSGMIGAGIGYTLAPRKYNLEQLLTQKPDVFEKTIPKMVIEKATEEQKSAYDLLTDGRKIMEKAAKSNVLEAKLSELTDTPAYSKAYREIKGFLPKARVQTAIVLGFIGALVGTMGKIIFGTNNY